MPTIVTYGAIAARGFGFSPCISKDGTKAIFSLGWQAGGVTNAVATRNRYLYSTCASTACGVGAASANSYGSSGAGNAYRGIFALGRNTAGAGSTTRNKYIYSYCTSTASGVGAASSNSSDGSAAGNSTRGIFALGLVSNSTVCSTYSTTRNKYTYATDASTACGVGAASKATAYGAAAGNSTRGIFAIGAGKTAGICVVVKTRNKYTYACCTSTATGVGLASLCSASGSAAGNCSRGIFALGYQFTNLCNKGPSAVRNKYTYACDTSVAATSASIASESSSAAGNSTRGIFALGCRSSGPTPQNNSVTTRDKYTYASDTSTSSGVGAASANSSHGSATSWIVYVNCGV